jgi:hypothetical protein
MNPAYEITTDLPHLHTTSYTVQAMQPGNPSSTAIGSYTVNLHPPGSEGFAVAKAIYDQLDYYLRLEFYLSHDAASLGKLVFAGPITGIDKQRGETNVYTLTGATDLQWVNLSRPFPGETLSLAYGSGSGITATYRQVRNYFGTNEPGWMDTFNPFTLANYTSSNLPGLTSGTWTGATDDGLTAATCNSGTGAILISKSGAIANDLRLTQFVEIAARLQPSSTSATNAGKVGVGISASSANAKESVAVWVQAKWNATSSHWDLDLVSQNFGVLTTSQTISNFLTTVDDPDGFIPVTLSLVVVGNGAGAGVANGHIQVGSTAFGFQLAFSSTGYPFLFFGTPATGSATAFITNLVQMTRYTDDLNPGIAAFKSGSIGSPAHSLQNCVDPGPTFLEIWTRGATIEGWYWRYTPQPYVLGSRTLGTIDFTGDPGTDLGTTRRVVFDR